MLGSSACVENPNTSAAPTMTTSHSRVRFRRISVPNSLRFLSTGCPVAGADWPRERIIVSRIAEATYPPASMR